MKVHMLAAALLLVSGVSRDVDVPLSIAVTPMQSFAPTTLTIRVHVPPDDANRALDVVADSGNGPPEQSDSTRWRRSAPHDLLSDEKYAGWGV